jgi:hypothetical protein
MKRLGMAILFKSVWGIVLGTPNMNCTDPDEVDWFVRKMKQVALKEREEIFRKEELIH